MKFEIRLLKKRFSSLDVYKRQDVSSGIVPEESKEVLESNLSEEEFAIISKENEEVTFKFKLLEFFNNISNTLTAKK